MSSDTFVVLCVGFLFGYLFTFYVDFLIEVIIYFHHKNKDYREIKQDKKSKKEEVEK